MNNTSKPRGKFNRLTKPNEFVVVDDALMPPAHMLHTSKQSQTIYVYYFVGGCSCLLACNRRAMNEMLIGPLRYTSHVSSNRQSHDKSFLRRVHFFVPASRDAVTELEYNRELYLETCAFVSVLITGAFYR